MAAIGNVLASSLQLTSINLVMCEKDKTYKLLEIGPNDDNTNNDSVPIRNRERERERERERFRGMGSADTLVVLGTFVDVVCSRARDVRVHSGRVGGCLEHFVLKSRRANCFGLLTYAAQKQSRVLLAQREVRQKFS